MRITAEGHYKIVHPEKHYKAMLRINGEFCGTRRPWKRATEANEYGERLVERYHRFCDFVLASERPHKTEEF